MKRFIGYSSMFALALLLTGCRTYQFQLVEPAAQAQVVTKEPIRLTLDPLEYELTRRGDQIEMRIINPTDDRVVLQGERSFVVDPNGESHPLRGRVVAPSSYTALMLPPGPDIVPAGVSLSPRIGYSPYWGLGFSHGYGYGYHSGFATDLYYAPTVNYGRVVTPYDWDWSTGPARIRLSYEREGQFFDHDFELLRQRVR